MLHWLELRRRPARNVQNWSAYLNTALDNRARDWVAEHQAEERMISMDAATTEGEDERATLEGRLRSIEPAAESTAAVFEFLDESDPWLSTVLKALLQTDGNLTRAAKRLRVHRNTIRAAIRRLALILKHHEFGDRR